MCGIFVSIIKRNDDNVSCYKSNILELIKRRGPDYESSHIVQNEHFIIQFTSSVLFIRGEEVSIQPVILSDGSVLMFNGEIFQFSSDSLGDDFSFDDQKQLTSIESDTDLLAALIEKEKSIFPQILSYIKGPYAIIFFDNFTNRLWFGRDVVGRRSLCKFTSSGNNHMIISSIAASSNQWEEVSTEGIHCIDLSNDQFSYSLHRWSHSLSGEELSNPAQSSIKTCLPINLPKIESMDEAVNCFKSAFISSIRKRVCLRRDGAKVAILFSGGIDSTVIAIICNNFIPKDESIDLLNVAFKDDAPDRLTAINAYEALSNLFPERIFNLVQINPSQNELEQLRSERIRFLIYPCQTVLDDSVGCALWFASRGTGILYPNNDVYQSTATILLHGLGADEQLAGYSRHRRVYFTSNRSIEMLEKELKMDLERLNHRNLGRDDRVVSDHGKEVRFPFLDEDLIGFLNHLPSEYKFNLDETRGKGEKKLLRTLAQSLGLGELSFTEKRAMQFGSRIAKLEKSKESGSMKCSRLE